MRGVFRVEGSRVQSLEFRAWARTGVGALDS